MTERELRHEFKVMSNCSSAIDGEIIPAITEDRFIELLKFNNLITKLTREQFIAQVRENKPNFQFNNVSGYDLNNR